MSRKLRRLTEAQIRKAEAEGKLGGLAGEGKPLPHRPGDLYIDAGDAAGFRIMAEAGALPEEIHLRRQVATAGETLRAARGEVERKAAMAALAELETKLAIAADARRRFLRD